MIALVVGFLFGALSMLVVTLHALERVEWETEQRIRRIYEPFSRA